MSKLLADKKKLFDIDKDNLMFHNKALFALLIPIVVEQLLNSFMGMVDTMMVSNLGSQAISGVSLVDSVNNLIVQLFSAMATGAAIICSHYIGMKDREGANKAARQVVLTVATIAVVITIAGLILRRPLLSFIFGKVEPEVMSNAVTYFLYTALSYPFLALFSAGSAIFRSCGNSRYPMMVSVISNVINVCGNALLMFVFNMGVAGAAISTLVSRVFCMVVIFIALSKPKIDIVVSEYHKIRPDYKLIGSILAIGVPSGIENSLWNRCWYMPYDCCRTVSWSRKKRRSQVLHSQIVRNSRDRNYCILYYRVCTCTSYNGSWWNGDRQCKNVYRDGWCDNNI